MKDIKLLLTTQAHYDHLGAMAAIKKSTGAAMWANAPEAGVLKDGGASDYTITSGIASFEPITPDSLLTDGATMQWGSNKLVMKSHPGHTKGSCSYLLTTSDNKRTYTVLIANMPTIVTDEKFSEVDTYPSIQQDYAYTLHAMKNLAFDLWVASHASQFNLHKKRKPGDRYAPTRFADKQNFYESIRQLKKQYEAHLKR